MKHAKTPCYLFIILFIYFIVNIGYAGDVYASIDSSLNFTPNVYEDVTDLYGVSGKISMNEAIELARGIDSNFGYVGKNAFERSNGDRYYVLDVRGFVDGSSNSYSTHLTYWFVSFDGKTCVEGDKYSGKALVYSNKNLLKKLSDKIITVDRSRYKITEDKEDTVTFLGTKKQKEVFTIPETVIIDSISYKVTSVGTNAFKNNTKIKTVTIGKNVISIEKKAFYGCKRLKKIVIKSASLKSIGKNAFKGINEKATIKVPKKRLSAYRKLLKGKGQGKKATIQ